MAIKAFPTENIPHLRIHTASVMISCRLIIMEPKKSKAVGVQLGTKFLAEIQDASEHYFFDKHNRFHKYHEDNIIAFFSSVLVHRGQIRQHRMSECLWRQRNLLSCSRVSSKGWSAEWKVIYYN